MGRFVRRFGRACLACITVLAALAGCASAPPAPVAVPATPAAFFDDAAFAPPVEPVSAQGLFDLSPAMQRYLHAEGTPPASQPDPRRHLVDMLYRRQKLALEYDAGRTRTAAEAFDARAGNCLSLVMMTAAFAKAMGLPVYYQQVEVDEAWSRQGDLYFASGHVNLMLDVPPLRSRWERDFDAPLIVDFMPAEALRGRRFRALAEATVAAMFMNNRAAEALASGRVDDAYWWTRGALQQDPAFLTAWNTLGVVYLRHGRPLQAVAVFEAALAREADNTKLMGNLVPALQAAGRPADAARVAARLAQVEPVPPFHFFNAGLQALRERDYPAARDHFVRELRRESTYHETHFWLAQALLALGEGRRAMQHLELAHLHSSTLRDQAIYAAKLDRLRAQRLH